MFRLLLSHLQAEYTIILGSYFNYNGSVVILLGPVYCICLANIVVYLICCSSRASWCDLSIFWTNCRTVRYPSQSQSHITTDSRSANRSRCQAPIWDSRPIFLSPWYFLETVAGLLFCGALSEERTGL
jgi:hypothetical protein